MQRGKQLLGKRLLLVTAHPDDESYLAAGLLWQNVVAGGTNMLVCATLGEKGKYHLAKLPSERKLKSMRKAECMSACRYLRVVKVTLLDLPDGSVSKHKKKIVSSVKKAAVKFKPDFIISFGSDGLTGHRDHIAVGVSALRAAYALHIPLLIFTLSARVSRTAKQWMLKRQKNPFHAKEFTHSKPDICVAINPKTKLAALHLYVSQLDNGDPFKHFPKFAKQEFLTKEYFSYVTKKR